jgi:hypothetical protein
VIICYGILLAVRDRGFLVNEDQEKFCGEKVDLKFGLEGQNKMWPAGDQGREHSISWEQTAKDLIEMDRC